MDDIKRKYKVNDVILVPMTVKRIDTPNDILGKDAYLLGIENRGITVSVETIDKISKRIFI